MTAEELIVMLKRVLKKAVQEIYQCNGDCTPFNDFHKVLAAADVYTAAPKWDCEACEFEAKHGTRENPHPVHFSVHDCSVVTEYGI